MDKIYTSASKLVFILMALATIAGLFTNKVDTKDFITLSSMAFAFYFSNKGDNSQPYAGK